MILRKAADSGESSGGALRQASTRIDNVPNVPTCPTWIGRRLTRAVILSALTFSAVAGIVSAAVAALAAESDER